KEWLDYRYGDLDKAEKSPLDEELEKRFKHDHEKKWDAYEKKKDKTYNPNPTKEEKLSPEEVQKKLVEKDHALTQLNKDIEEHSLNRYKFLDREDSEESWEKVKDKIVQYHWMKFAES